MKALGKSELPPGRNVWLFSTTAEVSSVLHESPICMRILRWCSSGLWSRWAVYSLTKWKDDEGRQEHADDVKVYTGGGCIFYSNTTPWVFFNVYEWLPSQFCYNRDQRTVLCSVWHQLLRPNWKNKKEISRETGPSPTLQKRKKNHDIKRNEKLREEGHVSWEQGSTGKWWINLIDMCGSI